MTKIYVMSSYEYKPKHKIYWYILCIFTLFNLSWPTLTHAYWAAETVKPPLVNAWWSLPSPIVVIYYRSRHPPSKVVIWHRTLELRDMCDHDQFSSDEWVNLKRIEYNLNWSYHLFSYTQISIFIKKNGVILLSLSTAEVDIAKCC